MSIAQIADHPRTLSGAEVDELDSKLRVAQQSLAADGAIACFSSSFLLRSLNADRAPQLKASVRCFVDADET